MEIKKFILEQTIKWIAGKEVYDSIKRIVESLMDTKMDGDKKRQIALQNIKHLGLQASSFVINLTLETVVFLLKNQISKK